MFSRFAALAERVGLYKLALPAALVVAVLMMGINEFANRGAQSKLERLVEVGKTRILLMQTLQRTTEAESGKRGYLITGGREYLGPYLEARNDVQAKLEQLKANYAELGDAAAQSHLVRLETLINARLAEMEEVKALFDAGKNAEAIEVVRKGVGHGIMLQVGTEANSLVAWQNERIAGGLADIFDTLTWNRLGIHAMAVVAMLALWMFVRLSRQLDQQQALRQAETAAERDRLEQEVSRRTAELTELARHLQTAREDERAHLARELHDELGALLTAAKLDVARIKPKIQQAMPDLVPRLTHLTDSLNGGIALKRRIIEDLRPSTLDSLGLGPALEVLCSEFADRSGLVVAVQLAPVELNASAELTVFRVVQEALTNIAKYAQAQHVKVTLGMRDGEVDVEVSDDGVGFDSRNNVRGSHGLLGMKFRVTAEGGRLLVRSAPGQGCSIRAQLPVGVPRRAVA